MANKRPLVINTTTNQIEEISASDTLTCDGGGLTGVSGSSGGVAVQDGGSAKGTASTLNFGTGLTAGTVSGGVSLITGTGISNVVEDTTPQLGGDLDTNAKMITFGDSTNITANNSMQFGTNAALRIGVINNIGVITNDATNTAGLLISQTNSTANRNLILQGRSGQSTIVCDNDGTNSHAHLFSGGTLRLETTSTGVTIDGALTAGGLTYPNTNGTSGQQLTSDGAGNVTWGAAGSGGGGTSLGSRTTKAGTTGTLAAGASADLNITGAFKAYALLKIAIDHPAWVVLYTNDTTRTADDARAEGTDPTPGSGVLAEVLTTTAGASTFVMTPGLLGWNDDGTPATTIYAKVKNKDSSSRAITVTLTVIQLEA